MNLAIATHTLVGRQIQDDGQAGIPLVVDLDGTLVRSDLLIENFFDRVAQEPRLLLQVPRHLWRGKSRLKNELARDWRIDPTTLPYDPEVLAAIEAAAAEGRPIYLASASNASIVSEIAEHLGTFDGWFASDETTNLAGSAKARVLCENFGEGGFDYIGNDAADLEVWKVARRSFSIRASRGLSRRLVALGTVAPLSCTKPTWRTWVKLLRVHQYAKNALLFVPLITSHSFTLGAFGNTVLGAIAFSLVASAVYVVNDLADLRDDRRHHSKRNRPLACGAIDPRQALAAVPLLLVLGFAAAALVSAPFAAVLAGYLALTSVYSFYLKQKMLLDVVTLAALYSVRVVAGAVAIGVSLSEWLIGFCMLIFTALALIKRYVELAARRNAQLPDSSRRDYRQSDLPMIGWMAAAVGFNAVTVFGLYISTQSGRDLYSQPGLLWLLCPLLLYWFARVLVLAHRGEMHDDPVVFALRDRASLAMLALAGGCILLAI